MNGLKVAVIGAGSSYTPEIVEGLALHRSELPVERLAFADIDRERMEVVAGFCRRFLAGLGAPIPITTTVDLAEAIEDASYVVTQIRVGGNAQRVLDEKIPLKYGILGQETTGPGGMFKAFRTIPAMLEIARTVEAVSPSAWIINYTNPTGLVAEAILKHTRARMVGLCSGGLFPRNWVARALGIPARGIAYDYYGLNHLSFAYNVQVDGRLLSDEEFDRVAEVSTWGAVDPALIKTLRVLPSPYLQYYFHRRRSVEAALAKGQTRGEAVQALEAEVFAAYADPDQATKPAALAKRGGGGYSEVALGIMDALHNNRSQVVVANVANRGAAPRLPADAVLEMPCLVNSAGIVPLVQPEPPPAVWGLVAAVKNYEQLAVAAAVTGDRTLALEALLAHPLCGDYDAAVALLDEMLAANRPFLPQFFG